MNGQVEDADDRSLTIALDREAERAADGGVKTVQQGTDENNSGVEAKTGKAWPLRTGYPEDLEHRYYVVAEKNGDVHRVYADSKGERELFRDYGEELRTKQADQMAVKAMLDTAQHRGWDNIALRGSKDFRREAWLEASARGLAVRGYEPTELDRQELSRREQPFLKNEIRNGEVVERERERATKRQPPVRIDYRRGIEGTVIEVGTRPYRDNPEASPSPYVELELADGKKHTAWGMGLPDALGKANVEKGDRIALRETGKESVSVTLPGKVDGQFVETRVERRGWEARQLDQAQEHKADKRIQALGGAENSLHAGPGREVAFEGTDANEKRAKQYLEQGRGAAAATPQLKSAASLESFVERQLRSELGHKPAAMNRAMNVARHRIADMIRHGIDVPEPRITDERAKQLDPAKSTSAAQERKPDMKPERSRERQRTPERSR